MSTSNHKTSDERSVPAYDRVWRFVARHRVVVIGVMVLATLAAGLGYYSSRPKGVWVATITVLKTQTGRVTNDLSISLTNIKERSDPPGYTVMATVTYTGLPDMQISNASEGYIVTYPKEHGYRIELLKANSGSAKFSISKMP